MITKIKLDESMKLEFGVSVSGAEGKPESRFIIEGKDFDILVKANQVGENFIVDVPQLKGILESGEHPTRFEVILDGKLYTPLRENMMFAPAVKIRTESKQLIEAVKITVNRSELSDDLAKKIKVASTIAESFGYNPAPNETPVQIINSTLLKNKSLSKEKTAILTEMLMVAKSVGVNYDEVLTPTRK